MRRPALTLLELLIVLAILAVLTIVAVQSMEGVIDANRYDGSVRALTSVRAALLGQDAMPGSGGFIADIGRPPLTLDELLTSSSGTASHPLDTDGDGVADDSLTAGWRGPYLRLPPGFVDLRDGWGNPLDYANSSGDLLVRSFGADGLPGGESANTDLSQSIPLADYTGTLTIRLREMVAGIVDVPQPDSMDSTTDIILVRVFRVVNGVPTLLEPIPSVNVGSSSSYTLTLPHMVTGPLVVRAVRRDAIGPPLGAIKRRSPAVHLVISPRATVTETLILR